MVSSHPMDYTSSLSSNVYRWSEESDVDTKMPTLDDVVDFGRRSCDERFPRCGLVDFAASGIMG